VTCKQKYESETSLIWVRSDLKKATSLQVENPIKAKNYSCLATVMQTPRGRGNSYSFLNSALDGGEWSALRSGRSLLLGKDPRYPLEWASEMVWTQRLEEKSFASVGDRIPVVQSEVRLCIHWATPYPQSKIVPLRHIGAKEERTCSSNSFLTSELDEGEWNGPLVPNG
jgi:hypothetical protein